MYLYLLIIISHKIGKMYPPDSSSPPIYTMFHKVSCKGYLESWDLGNNLLYCRTVR